MKKKDIATTIGLTAILFILVVMLGGCAKDLPLEGITKIDTQIDTQNEQIVEIKDESEDVTQICSDTQVAEINVEIESTEDGEICIGLSKETLRNHVMDFSTELFQNSIKKEGNTLVSPVSVMMALSMTANGAKGETLAEMEEAFGTSVKALNIYFWEYQRNLPQGEDYRFHIANSIWINNDRNFSVKENFIRTNEDYYYAGIYKTNFSQKTIKDINQWVAQNTDGMITDIVSEIPESTMMYLINALAFDAKWQEPYKESSVKTGTFTKENGETQKVSFMHSTEGGFLEDDNTTGFVKSYKDGKYAFVALLPKEGVSMQDYTASLSGEKITALLENPQRAIVHAYMPKFENECIFDMEPILNKMGIKDAFDIEKADLSGLGSYDGFNTYIDTVTHKTYISVAEQGTKAGAVTVITDNAKSAMMDIKRVELNRPFVYMVIDCEENLPLFMGTVSEIDEK